MHAVAMNNLCATWHNPADVDLGDEFEPDVVELLSRARDHMEGIGELGDALRLVEVAFGQVSAWAAAQRAEPATVRSSSCAGSR